MEQAQNGHYYYPTYPNYMTPTPTHAMYIPNQPIIVPQVYNTNTYHLEKEIKDQEAGVNVPTLQDFLKKADAELSRLSGVDLSNPNNVAQATNIFRPLVNDKQYVKDLYLTQAQDAEIQKMEVFFDD